MRFKGRAPALLLAVLLAAFMGYAGRALLPTERWQGTFWPRWTTTLGLLAVFALGCFATGRALVERLTPTARRDGTLALSGAVGLLVAALATGTFGLLHALGPGYFVTLPLVMTLVGWPSLVREVRTWREQPAARYSAGELVALAFGVVAIALLVTQVLSPDNINFDARWYHLRAAERYALAGGQVRTPEGDYLLALPQLSSWLYTWAFLAPLVGPDGRLQLAMHLELLTVLVTLATIPPLTRALLPRLPREASRLSWVAFFTFPSVFGYDTGLLGGSDHIAALWAAPMLLTWWQARDRADWHSWVLWGLVTTGALAKYTSLFLVLPMAVVAAVDLAVRFRKADRVARLGPFLAAGTTLVLSAPYWLRNWVWYGNPVYPMGARLFHNVPWHQDATALLARASVPVAFKDYGLPIPAREWTVSGTLDVLVGYWRDLYIWADFTGGQAVFGFSFAAAVVALPFLRGTRRAWVAVVLLHLGVATWFNVRHEMRYLTVLIPPMAAVVGGVFAAAWGSRRLELRGVLVWLVGFQLATYGDLPFRRTHRLNGHRSPVEAGLEAIANPGAESGATQSFKLANSTLPPSAVVLVHGVELTLGLQRQTITDVPGLQFGLDVGRLGSVAALHARAVELGVTHVAWSGGTEQMDSLAGEVLFLAWARQSVAPRALGPLTFGERPTVAPPELQGGVLYVGCAGLYPTGLYALGELAEPLPNWPAPFPEVKPLETAATGMRCARPARGVKPLETAADWHALLPKAGAVVVEDGCDPGPPPGEFTYFETQRAPHRAWKHFQRVAGTVVP